MSDSKYWLGTHVLREFVTTTIPILNTEYYFVLDRAISCAYIVSLKPQYFYEEGAIISLTLKMRDFRLKELKGTELFSCRARIGVYLFLFLELLVVTTTSLTCLIVTIRSGNRVICNFTFTIFQIHTSLCSIWNQVNTLLILFGKVTEEVLESVDWAGQSIQFQWPVW